MVSMREVSPSVASRRAIVNYRQKYVLGGLSLLREGVVRLNDRPNMTNAIYRGGKTITQQQEL